MKITICASLDFSNEMGEIKKQLESMGHEVLLPASAEKVLNGEANLESIKKAKSDGSIVSQAIDNNVIMTHYKKIVSSDAILVLNYHKKNTPGYIGGSVFLEMGFAYINNKSIFLWNGVPNMSYGDELETMQPIIIKHDLSKIK